MLGKISAFLAREKLRPHGTRSAGEKRGGRRVVLIMVHGRSLKNIYPSHPYNAGKQGGGGGVGDTILWLALVFLPFAMYPFRDGAPFLRLLETPSTHLGARDVSSSI